MYIVYIDTCLNHLRPHFAHAYFANAYCAQSHTFIAHLFTEDLCEKIRIMYYTE